MHMLTHMHTHTHCIRNLTYMYMSAHTLHSYHMHWCTYTYTNTHIHRHVHAHNMIHMFTCMHGIQAHLHKTHTSSHIITYMHTINHIGSISRTLELGGGAKRNASISGVWLYYLVPRLMSPPLWARLCWSGFFLLQFSWIGLPEPKKTRIIEWHNNMCVCAVDHHRHQVGIWHYIMLHNHLSCTCNGYYLVTRPSPSPRSGERKGTGRRGRVRLRSVFPLLLPISQAFRLSRAGQ